MSKPATEAEDAKIVAVPCMKACFQGYVGMDRCGKCDGKGSQLQIAVNDPPPLRSRSYKRFPNTKRGYDQALKALRAVGGTGETG